MIQHLFVLSCPSFILKINTYYLSRNTGREDPLLLSYTIDRKKEEHT